VSTRLTQSPVLQHSDSSCLCVNTTTTRVAVSATTLPSLQSSRKTEEIWKTSHLVATSSSGSSSSPLERMGINFESHTFERRTGRTGRTSVYPGKLPDFSSIPVLHTGRTGRTVLYQEIHCSWAVSGDLIRGYLVGTRRSVCHWRRHTRSQDWDYISYSVKLQVPAGTGGLLSTQHCCVATNKTIFGRG